MTSPAPGRTVTSADELVAEARHRITRVGPEDLAVVVSTGGLVVDIRPDAQRRDEGLLPDALVVERNVLEWRFDLTGAHHLDAITGYDQQIVIVCSEGYASSLAAESLLRLGYERVADLAGGYRAWRRYGGAGAPGN